MVMPSLASVVSNSPLRCVTVEKLQAIDSEKVQMQSCNQFHVVQFQIEGKNTKVGWQSIAFFLGVPTVDFRHWVQGGASLPQFRCTHPHTY
jgi:hypothetical protein